MHGLERLPCWPADYFGQKIHVDQNEKLGKYGVTNYAAIDGYGGTVVGFLSILCAKYRIRHG